MTTSEGKLQFRAEKSPSTGPKTGITSWYIICALSAVLLTLFGSEEEIPVGSLDRQVLLLACVAFYIARAAATLFTFVKRRIPWWEAAYGGGMIGVVLFVFLRQGLKVPQPLDGWDVVAIVLYLAGSYIGTASEYGRHVWKTQPENKGHLYTGGLFRFSRHINYFGDLLLFFGLGMLTRQLWTGIVPLAMGLNFVLSLIPAQDAYLATRYGDEFAEYARRTKKLVPFLY